MRIELETKDYPGFASATVDLVTPGRPGKPHCGDFNRRVDVFLGREHVVLTHHEWGITLNGGPKLRARYLEARPRLSGGDHEPAGIELVRFVERAIRRHAGSSPRAFTRLLKAAHADGLAQGREEARAKIRKAIGA